MSRLFVCHFIIRVPSSATPRFRSSHPQNSIVPAPRPFATFVLCGSNSSHLAINEARDRGDIELLERIAKDPQAFIRQQGWASVSRDGDHTLMELRSLY